MIDSSLLWYILNVYSVQCILISFCSCDLVLGTYVHICQEATSGGQLEFMGLEASMDHSQKTKQKKHR